jgi:hypothetical protein
MHVAGQMLVIVPLLIVSMAMLVVNSLPPFIGADGSPVAFPGKIYPMIVFGVVCGGTVYYLFVFGLARRHYSPPPTDQPVNNEAPMLAEHGPMESFVTKGGRVVQLGKLSLLERVFHIKPSFWIHEWYAIGTTNEPAHNATPLKRVLRFGRRWTVVYTMHRAYKVRSLQRQRPIFSFHCAFFILDTTFPF